MLERLEALCRKHEDIALKLADPKVIADLKQFKKVLKESSSLDSIPIKTHLSETEAARFAANKLRFEGVEIKSRLFRRYPKGAFASHLIGHINRINEEDKEAIKKLGWQQNYKGTDSIGKLGIEKYYETQLHGTTGFQEVEIDANGNSVRILNSTPSIEGDSITLSIDSNLQEIAENAFNNLNRLFSSRNAAVLRKYS